jgi:hypothetical protein
MTSILAPGLQGGCAYLLPRLWVDHCLMVKVEHSFLILQEKGHRRGASKGKVPQLVQAFSPKVPGPQEWLRKVSQGVASRLQEQHTHCHTDACKPQSSGTLATSTET